MRPLARLHDALTQISFGISAALLGLVTAIYCLEVMLRYIFNAPTTWGGEAISYSLCASIFLAMPHVTKVGAHVAVTVVIEKSSPAVGRLISWIIYLVAFVICTIATWISFDENVRQFVQDVHLMRVHPIPKWYISVFITYGFGMSALHYLRKVAGGVAQVQTLSSGNV